jgi:hypothetical protein
MKSGLKISVALLGIVLAPACSSIIEGTSQTLLVNTNPAGAACTLNRNDEVIGKVVDTPNSIVVQKTKHNITLVCSKEGYQDATFFNKSDAAGATFGNIILGGGIGWAIDSASGADNKYTTPMNITLLPK